MAAVDVRPLPPPPPPVEKEIISEPVSIIKQRPDRPLPPIPTDDRPPVVRRRSSRRSGPIPISTKAAGKRRAVPSIYISLCITLSKVVKEPRVLARLLPMLPWPAFHSLVCTCRELRHLLGHAELRDAILSQYVPGYRACLAHAIPDREHVVEVTIHDLALFKLSQSVPLHRYPMHALSIVSSPLFVPERLPSDPRTLRYVALAHAYSRVVLLLQSLVHSGFTFVSEIDADDFTLLPPTGTPIQKGLRELVFPKPLSFFDRDDADADPPPNQKATTLPSRKTLRRASIAGSTLSRTQTFSSFKSPRASADFWSMSSRRASSKNPLRPLVTAFGGGPKVPLPRPHDNSPALQYYTSGWRRSLAAKKSGTRSYPTSEEEDDFLSKPRRRPFFVNHSAESSVGSSSPGTSGSSSPSSSASNSNLFSDASSVSPVRETNKLPSFPATAPVPRSASTSPHDLSMATSRFRAPVLRVFVPCTQLDEVTISHCEDQLMDQGLWDQLSEGDIICNFGFVPLSEPETSSQSSSSSSSCGKQDRERQGHRRRWLMFNGYGLVHFIPPSPPPLQCALALPSPFYYAHILPPLSHARYILSQPPLIRQGGATPTGASGNEPFASLTLSNVRTRISSPHCPSGYAVVKKYKWVARIPYVGPNSGTEAGAELGEGWQGEWILEAEGTQEGRQQLLDAVTATDTNGRTRRGLWEIVRDKSGGGRIWMRLITPDIDSRGPHVDLNAILNDSPQTQNDTSSSRTGTLEPKGLQ